MIPKAVDDIIASRFIRQESTYANDDIFMAEVFSTIFEESTKEVVHEPVTDVNRKDLLYLTFKRGDEIWQEVSHFMNHTYNQDFTRMGFLLAMESHFSKYKDKSAHDAIIQYLDSDVGATFFDDVDPEITMDPATIEKYIDHSDPNLLHQFFQSFQDIGTFHRKLSDYDKSEDQEKYMKMLALYTKLMQR